RQYLGDIRTNQADAARLDRTPRPGRCDPARGRRMADQPRAGRICVRADLVRGDNCRGPGKPRLPPAARQDRAVRRTGRTMMEALDGNAIGGLLHEVFGTEMTAATATCASCGTTGPVAQFTVFMRGPGTVARCRTCSAVLMVIVHAKGMNCVDL